MLYPNTYFILAEANLYLHLNLLAKAKGIAAKKINRCAYTLSA
jgi:hypothetical protein